MNKVYGTGSKAKLDIMELKHPLTMCFAHSNQAISLHEFYAFQKLQLFGLI